MEEANRLGGMRATVPGFLDKTKAAQIGGAVGSVLGDAGQSVADGAGSAWDLIKSKLAKPAIGSLESAALSSKGKLIELAARCAK